MKRAHYENKKPRISFVHCPYLPGFSPFVLHASSQGQDEEVRDLKEVVSQLSRQNALLQEQSGEFNTDELEAPPPPRDDSEAEMAVSTPTPETLPEGPVPADEPIVYDGWPMQMSQNIEIDPWIDTLPLIYFDILLKNLGMNNSVFRYSNAAFSLKVDLGNVYPYYPGFPGNRYNCEQEYHTLKNLTVPGEDSELLEGHPRDCNDLDNFVVFEGPVPLEANKFILMFSDFGPFSNIEVVIDQ